MRTAKQWGKENPVWEDLNHPVSRPPQGCNHQASVALVLGCIREAEQSPEEYPRVMVGSSVEEDQALEQGR